MRYQTKNDQNLLIFIFFVINDKQHDIFKYLKSFSVQGSKFVKIRNKTGVSKLARHACCSSLSVRRRATTRFGSAQLDSAAEAGRPSVGSPSPAPREKVRGLVVAASP